MRHLSLLSGVLVVCGMAGCVSGTRAAGKAEAIGPETLDYTSLREEAVLRLGALRTATARAAEAGIGGERERVTITTAELFLTYIAWDKAHLKELEANIASWWRVKKDAPRLARELPDREMRDLVQVLTMAQRELADVMQGKVTRRPTVEIDMTALEEHDGYYRQEGRAVFPSTFVWQPDDEKLNRAYGVIGGHYIHLPHIKAEGEKADVRYEPDDDEPMGYVFMGQKHVPRWLLEKVPEITDGKHHYTGFDTDHPVARELWATMLADVVPQFAGRKVSQAGYLLTNEPHWYTSTGGWARDPVSEKTKAKFRVWLEQRHKTINVLNTLWESTFASFAEVTIEIPIDATLRGKPIWYDWCRFNMIRITDWFSFLKREIRRHDPTAQTHIKLIPGQFSGSDRDHGLDFEALVRLQGIIGCDAGIVITPHWRNKEAWPDRYACNWRAQALPLDFFRSISPEKVVFDSEWHGLSTSNLRAPDMPAEYVRSALWLAHLHGTGMNQTWYWSRNADGALSKRSGSAFYASNLAQPLVMDAYGRTMKELNAFAPEVVALATQPRNVRFFYSEACAIQDAAYMGHVYDAYRALYHSGMALGFATGGILNDATEAELSAWPVLIVTHADHVTADDRQALERYLGQGGALLVAGADSLKQDEYARSVAALKTGKGKILRIEGADEATLIAQLKAVGLTPALPLKETNAVGQPGCVWRTAQWEGGQLLLINNLG
ncbi:MAG: hypothetical protein HN406_00395, partial [Lentisphaerae bacterium]|nr:hypothetical protein [Lentisphaerota bacterium]